MRVLQINSVCGIGSTGRIATDIHNMLIEKGHESYVAYGRYLPKNCDDTIRIGTKFDNYTHGIKTRVFDRHGFGSRRVTIEFIDKLKQINPDIIHLHNIHGYYINIEILFNYLKKANKPVVWTLHDCWSFTGHCAHFDYIGCDSWKTDCFNCPEKHSYPSSLFFCDSKNNYSRKKRIFTGLKNMTIITPSKWLAKLVKESFLREYPIKVINNGIALDIFKPMKSNFREEHKLMDKFIILGVASTWTSRKGFDHFIELSKNLSYDEVIIMIGLTDRQRKKLPDNIIGINRTNNVEELAEIYAVSDVYVNLTLEDTFPTTNIESMACGTPVITFDTGGSSESVSDNCGFVVDKGNLKEVINKIRMIKYNGKSKYTGNVINVANKFYNKEKLFNEYIDIYKQNVDLNNIREDKLL